MYEEIGKKIMQMARGASYLVISACIILSIFILFKAEEAKFQLILICAAIGYGAYVSTWAVYALGQLVDDVSAIREHMDNKNATPVSDELPDL